MFVEGNVRFDVNRTGAVGSSAPFPSVPVALQSLDSGLYIGAITNASGVYRFNDLPAGNYAVIVYWGCPHSVPSPASFNNAIPGLVNPIPSVTPPITALSNPPPNATNLDFLSQSTYMVSVAAADISNINFILGPVRYTPINIIPAGASIDPENLIQDADKGTFGSFSQGSVINRGATPSPPYPGLVPDYNYVMPDPAIFVPDGGQYGIQNVMTNNRSNVLGSWWRVADHTTGNETGRFMIVNGDLPGSSFFKADVTVKPYTYYAFLAWFLNIYRSTDYAPPEFGVRITCDAGHVYYTSLGSQLPVTFDMPEWKQKGLVFHSEAMTTITIEFISEAPEAWGNDYCVDDVTLNEITLPDVFEITKETDKNCVLYDQEVTIKITVRDISDVGVVGVRFIDELPPCLSFVAGSVVIDNVAFPAYNPTVGWVFDLDAGQQKVIEFRAKATCYPPGGTTCNIAQLLYNYPVIEPGVPVEYTVYSEPACVKIPQVYKDADGTVWITPRYQGDEA